MSHGERSTNAGLAGLFAVTLATLTLETLDTRLLSVLTWYHLSFLAVSLAMLGMAAGAVQVYLGGDRYRDGAAYEALSRDSLRLALVIPLAYFVNISLPIPEEFSTNAVISLALTCLALGVPFYLSGLVVTVALTRIPGQVGIVYAVDLLGAALGALLVLPLLSYGNMTSAILIASAVAAAGAASYRRFATGSLGGGRLAFSALMLLLAVANHGSEQRVRLMYSKGTVQATDAIWSESWSIHGQVVALKPTWGPPYYWGPGRYAGGTVESAFLVIDGRAGTSMTHWDGKQENLAWTQFDVTSLPYHLRNFGHDAVIGVGGGRDLLTALQSGASSVTGIEINKAFVDLLTGQARNFAHLADDPRVHLVHDEARSYLTRTTDRYDVLQMSLIDTWAATGAGAFTLSENGLYTLEAWDVFWGRLTPRGIFSVSRWYSPDNASETSRLVSLATAGLLRHGIVDPTKHLALVVSGSIATLLTSLSPLDEADLGRLHAVCENLGFGILLAPDAPPGDPLLGKIAASKSSAELEAALVGQRYDYSPPTDDRPYFFNVLRFSDLQRLLSPVVGIGVVAGNYRATKTLAILLVLVGVAVAVVIFGPLLRWGLPSMELRLFGSSIAYFSLIGVGFMFIQMGLMQRLSVYLGHPTYAVAVTLFSMITATGIGSYLSERVPVESKPQWVRGLGACAALFVWAVTWLMQPLMNATIRQGLPIRCAITVAMVVPVSLALGTFFPLGMRLVRRLGGHAEPWMWGVNGACGVLSSVVAVVLSMALGIRNTLFCGGLSYALLLVPAGILGSAVLRRPES